MDVVLRQNLPGEFEGNLNLSFKNTPFNTNTTQARHFCSHSHARPQIITLYRITRFTEVFKSLVLQFKFPNCEMKLSSIK